MTGRSYIRVEEGGVDHFRLLEVVGIHESVPKLDLQIPKILKGIVVNIGRVVFKLESCDRLAYKPRDGAPGLRGKLSTQTES